MRFMVLVKANEDSEDRSRGVQAARGSHGMDGGWRAQRTTSNDSSGLFLFALGLLMGSTRPFRDALVGAGLTLGIWLMFTRLLYVSLP